MLFVKTVFYPLYHCISWLGEDNATNVNSENVIEID